MYYSADDILGLTNITQLSHVQGHEIFDHGLGRDPRKSGLLAIYQPRISISPDSDRIVFGITHQIPLSMVEPSAASDLENAVQLLEHACISWQDYVSYQRLGHFVSMIPGDKPSNAESEDGNTSGSTHGRVPKKFALSPHHYGYIALHSLMQRTITSSSEGCTSDAMAIAHRALEELLPQQAYLFIPPHDLMMATKEAERIASEALKFAQESMHKQVQKPADVYGQVKRKLSHGIRALRIRHDGRMHIFPYTQLSAPDTGVATIAIIASQQQSIVNDHGRYSATSRGLVI